METKSHEGWKCEQYGAHNNPIQHSKGLIHLEVQYRSYGIPKMALLWNEVEYKNLMEITILIMAMSLTILSGNMQGKMKIMILWKRVHFLIQQA
jgi:hypothetical protein